MENLYTRQEVADLLKVQVPVIDRYIKSGKLKAAKLGDSKQAPVRIKESDLQAFIDESRRY